MRRELNCERKGIQSGKGVDGAGVEQSEGRRGSETGKRSLKRLVQELMCEGDIRRGRLGLDQCLCLARAEGIGCLVIAAAVDAPRLDMRAGAEGDTRRLRRADTAARCMLQRRAAATGERTRR